MRIKLATLLLGCLCILRMSGQFLNGTGQAPQNYEFSTGQINGPSGSPLAAPGTNDDVWRISIGGPNSPMPAVKAPYMSAWASEVANMGGWISTDFGCFPNDPANHGCLPGTQDLWFQVAFVLPNNPILVLNWQVAADDDVVGIYVNNTTAPVFTPPAGNNTAFPFNFSWCKWQPGLNTIYVRVKSTPTAGPNNRAALQVISWGYIQTTATGPSTVCANTSNTTYSLLPATSGATNYSWTMNPGAWTGSSSQNTINPNFGTTPVVLQAYAYSTQGCISTSTILVTPKQPTVGITTPATSVCPCTPIVLTATGAVTYSWNAPVPPPLNTTNPINRAPCTNQSYVVTGWDINGCKRISPPLLISMLPAPTVIASASPAIICSGVSNVLTASGASTYTWQPSPPGPTGSTWSVSLPLTNTAISVIGTAANGCTNTAVVTLTPGQLIPLSVPNVTVCHDMNLCGGIAATSSATYPISYSWLSPVVSNQSTANVCPPVRATTIYTVSASSSQACSNTATVAVTSQTCCPQQDSSVVVTMPNVPLCNLSFTNLAQYAYSVVPNGQAPFTGTISGQGVTYAGGMYNFNTAQNLSPGTYTITFTYTTQPFGCNYSVNRIVTLLPAPGVTILGPLLRCAYSPIGDTLKANLYTPISPWIFPVFYTWSPTNQVGTSIVVTPTVNTTYTVTVYSGNCVSTATWAIGMYNICCPQTSVTAALPVDSIDVGANNGLSLTGNLVINRSLVLSNPGNTPVNITFKNGDFIMNGGVQVIVRPNVTVHLEDAHFYACNIQWKGFVINNGAKLASQIGPMGRSTMIEDASCAINVSGMAAGHQPEPIDIQDVIFNRNCYAISISNSTLNTPLNFKILSCVFTSRNIPTGPFSWPSTSTTQPGLRYATPAAIANSLAPPFLLNNYPILGPKVLPTSLPCAIAIQNIGDTTGASLPGPGVNISAYLSPTASRFNLFDGMHVPITVENASFTSYNNTFQNSAVSSIYFWVNYLMNAGLNLSSPNAATANRFWMNNFNWSQTWSGNWAPHGIWADDLFELNISNAMFRGSSTGTAGPGNAITVKTSRFNNYVIQNNKFSNVAIGIMLTLTHGPNTVNGASPTTAHAHAGYMYIGNNFFSPQVSASAQITGNENLDYGIFISGPTGSVPWQIPGLMGNFVAQPHFIDNNIFDRVSNGILVQGMFRYPLGIINNRIDVRGLASIYSQNGIMLLRNDAHKTIRSNNISCSNFGSINSQVSNVSCFDNTLPSITCNTVTGGYNGFNFSGNNTGEWLGNTMSNNFIGLHLQGGSTNQSVIGPQGNPGMPSGNQWIGGNWGNGTWETWIDLPSSAANSPLFIDTAPTSMPNNNAGINAYSLGGTAPSLFLVNAPSYVCPPVWLINRTQQPATGLEETPDQNSQLSIYPNPNNGQFTIELYTDLQELKVSILDLTGKIVYSGIEPVENHKATLSLDLVNGIYFVSAQGSEGTQLYKKIVITN